jgi:HPt (histidine-containing phosphotransfer) domain-containing protein
MAQKDFDPNELMERVGNDRELLQQLYGLFEPRRVQLMQEIKAQAALPDAPALARAAHQLRGMLANMSGNRASELAGELELKGKSGQLHQVEATIEELDRAVNLLGQHLSQFVALQAQADSATT